MPKTVPRRANEDRFYTAQEAASFLRLTAETIKKKCRDGKIKGEQVGTKNQWRIKGSEINRLILRWKLDLL
jgi:excisionase family DNA binding protein